MSRRILCAAIAVVLLPATTVAQQAWTAEVSVEASYYEDGPEGRILQQSPDGRYCFYVLRRGDLVSDSMVHELHVLDLEVLAEMFSTPSDQAPGSFRHVTFRSQSKYKAISGARWVPGAAGQVMFLGAHGASPPQLYRLDVDAGRLVKLSDAPLGVTAFDAVGDTVLYEAFVGRRPRTSLQVYPATFVDPDDFDIPFNVPDEYMAALFVVKEQSVSRRIAEPYSARGRVPPRLLLSPDGARALALVHLRPHDVPAAWEGYLAASTQLGMRSAYEVRLMDMETLTVGRLQNAPTAYSVSGSFYLAPMLWSPDGQRVIVANTALPLIDGQQFRARTGYIIDHDVTDGTFVEIEALPMPEPESGQRARVVMGLGWGERGDLHVRYMGGAQSAVFRRTHEGWQRFPVSGAQRTQNYAGVQRGGLSVLVRQSANDPPRLLAIHEGTERVLRSQDERLRDVARAVVQELKWSDSSGVERRGGFFAPATLNRRTPLVIQVQQPFRPDRFLPDGHWPRNVYAAQVLASVGIAVLALSPQEIGTPDEGPAFVRAVDAAVEYLHEQGQIDRARVGLTGYSRGGYSVAYALANPGMTRFAAAVMADGNTSSYSRYLVRALGTARESAFSLEKMYQGGGSPWENKAEWVARAPGFNLDRVVTPTLLIRGGTHGNGEHLTWEMEFYAGLNRHRCPVDLLLFPHGAHPLARPREQLVSLQATVDWLLFWLADREYQAPDREQQYERWRRLRAKGRL